MQSPDYFNKESNKKKPDYFQKDPTTKISKRHEKIVANRSGGRRTPGSGNIKGKPGDVDDATFLRECKATSGAGMVLQGNWFSKIFIEALSTKRTPLIELRLEGQKDPIPKDWVIMTSDTFQNLINKIASN